MEIRRHIKTKPGLKATGQRGREERGSARLVHWRAVDSLQLLTLLAEEQDPGNRAEGWWASPGGQSPARAREQTAAPSHTSTGALLSPASPTQTAVMKAPETAG